MARINQEVPDALLYDVQSEIAQQKRIGKKVLQPEFINECIETGLKLKIKNRKKKESGED
jgi:hypothetical protein